MAKITIRNATIQDFDAIVKIEIDVTPQQSVILYQCPYIDRFPQDFYRATTEDTKRFFANASSFTDMLVMVAEAEDEKSPTGKTIIAYAVWDLMALGRKTSAVRPIRSIDSIRQSEADIKQFYAENRRDASWDRLEFSSDIMIEIEQKYLEPSDRIALPRTNVHLVRLSTAPAWQRHGAGTLLCNWGIELAQKHYIQIGLFASPSGHGLYTKLGFQELTVAHIQMPEENESVSIPAMKWYPKQNGIVSQVLEGIYELERVLGRALNTK